MKRIFVSIVLLYFISHGLSAAETEPESKPNATSSSTTIVGVDMFSGDSKITAEANGFSVSDTFDRSGLRLKFGAKKDNGARFEGFLEIEDYDAFDNGLVGIGGNLRYAFGQPGSFMPYFKLGISAGSTDLESDAVVQYEEESLSYFGLVMGLGIEKALNEKIDFQLGFDVGKRYWQDIEFRDQFNNRVVFEQEDAPVSVTAGLNFSL